MRIFDHRVKLDSLNHPLRIIPFGCVHADTEGFVESLWKDCLDDIAQPNTYAIGAGDPQDVVRTHARVAIRHYRTESGDDLRTLDKHNRDAYKDFYLRYLKRIEHKLITLVKGNHYWEFADGTTSDQYLCELTGCQYGDQPTYIRLYVEYGKRVIDQLMILVHHGNWGGGYSRLSTDVGSVETKAQQFPSFDILIFSHTHRKYAVHLTPDLYIPRSGAIKLVERPRVAIRTGAFTRTYVEKCLDHYAHKKLLPPTSLGYNVIEVHYHISGGRKEAHMEHEFRLIS